MYSTLGPPTACTLQDRLQDPRVYQATAHVLQDPQDQRAVRVIGAQPVNLVQSVQLGVLGSLEDLDLQETMEYQVSQDHLGNLEETVCRVHRA